MADKIFTRSPFYVVDNRPNGGSPIASAVLKLWVTNNQSTGGTPTYQVSTKAVDGVVTFEISGMVRDYLNDKYTGTPTESETNQMWAQFKLDKTYEDDTTHSTAVTDLEAFDGYFYFTDGVQKSVNEVINTPTISERIFLSTSKIYKPDSEQVNFGMNATAASTVAKTYKGTTLRDTLTAVNIPTADATTILEYRSTTNSDFDKIEVTQGGSVLQTIEVENVCESKYSPVRVTFVNKLGAMEDVWFFKVSKEALTVTNEKYTSNLISLGSYNTYDRQNSIYNKNGSESITLNSGYYDETSNETFKQLLLSESVWLKAPNGQILAINIKSSNLQYKTKLNDKLINYTIEAEYASSTINNVR